ncbi:MAG: hypothetical protein EU529_11590 [Promethearchaeota archaeon]|nr:MAG: hypothetical protein EU529_11590 [Candidatus Lokiarchaeota archaeon]
MLNEDEIFRENYRKIRLICPRCGKEKFLKVPMELTKHSENITTISIPSDFVCEHSFQAFIDKNFTVRAYHKADFEITKIEFYESESKDKEGIITYTLSQLIKNIAEILRASLIDKKMLGGAIFNLEGKVMYSSLPDEIFVIIASQLEQIEKKQPINIKQTILLLENNQKVYSKKLQLKEITLNLVLLMSSELNLTEANSYLEKLIAKIIDLESPKKKIAKKAKKPIKIEQPTNQFWIYSKVNYSSAKDGDTVYIDSLGISVLKSVIVNIDEIKDNPKFEGKIYFTQKYVNLMQGLALTLKDAAIFLNKLNKVP